MTVKYLDPWKDDKYGKLKGDKSEAYFAVEFSEAVVHKTDDAYIIAGHVTAYTGITRNYKPENELTPGLCAVPIYGKEYEVRKKDKDGNWISEKIAPSIFEKTLYQIIAADEDIWIPREAAISGKLTHVPNGMLAGQDEAQLKGTVSGNNVFTQVDLSGKLPEYAPPTGGGQRKGYSKSYGVSPDEKLAFIIKTLKADTINAATKESNSLAVLTEQFLVEHPEDERFSELYFEVLMACVR